LDKLKEFSVAGLRMLEKGRAQEQLISTQYIYDNRHKRVSIFGMLLPKLMDLFKTGAGSALTQPCSSLEDSVAKESKFFPFKM
jgi:hypothetical protein